MHSDQEERVEVVATRPLSLSAGLPPAAPQSAQELLLASIACYRIARDAHEYACSNGRPEDRALTRDTLTQALELLEQDALAYHEELRAGAREGVGDE